MIEKSILSGCEFHENQGTLMGVHAFLSSLSIFIVCFGWNLV